MNHQEVQAGDPCVKEAVKETYFEPGTKPDEAYADDVLNTIRKRAGWTLGVYLRHIFSEKSAISKSLAITVGLFLKGKTPTATPLDIAKLMYNHTSSRPPQVRYTQTPEGQQRLKEAREKALPMAQHQLREWAIKIVEELVSKEAKAIASKDGGFHVSAKEVTWENVSSFSLLPIVSKLERECPITMRLLGAISLNEDHRATSLSDYLTQPVKTGSGGNRRNPAVIIAFVAMVLLGVRNLQFSFLKRVFGIWLFANSASDTIFSVLSRIGLSVSYSTVLKSLRALSISAQNTVSSKAKARAFLVIYDNINRMKRAWNPDLGDRDTVLSGTAATYVELEDCDVNKAFDPAALKSSMDEAQRTKLNAEVLVNRIDTEKLDKTLTLHVLNFLVQEIDLPVFEQHRKLIANKFRSDSVAIHRMRDGRTTKVHPLATSDHNEGSTDGNQKVIDDLLIRQLKMEKEEVAKMLVIIGGDQSTIEKIRTLKRFLSDCPHGYSRYGWVLPLIQLWHMGWADLERILSTHWGAPGQASSGDISTYYFTNSILRRNIKNSKRPDFYPTQKFVFDNLKAEIHDCWKVHLEHEDLEKYFKENPEAGAFETLLGQAQEIMAKYLTVDAYSRILANRDHKIPHGSPWTGASSNQGHHTPDSAPSDQSDSDDTDGSDSDSSSDPDAMLVESDDDQPFTGDEILANTVLRLRDALIHYEFQYAIADGDIGRAMNVMAVWTFTFAGCGKNKYANELLELACNFEWEYSSDLQQAILNNWLCNLSGLPGCWFPMDLLQEHNIRQLKTMSQRRNAEFGGSFFQDIIAFNIRAFLQVNKSMKAAVRIGQKSEAHKYKKAKAAAKELGAAMTERELHKFRSGRRASRLAQDDFTKGHIIYSTTKKLAEFALRTEEDTNIFGESSDDEDGNVRSELTILPSVLVNGVLEEGADDNDCDDPEVEDDDITNE